MGSGEFSIVFQVMDINTSWNLFLRRLFIYMAKDVLFTLPQLMKFIWKEQKLVIHG